MRAEMAWRLGGERQGLKMDALPKDECDDGCGVWGRGEGGGGGRGGERAGKPLELELLAMDGPGSSPLSSSEGSISSASLNKHSSSRPHPSSHAQEKNRH